GMKLLCNRCAADDITTLQHQRLESSLGKIKGRDQPVVASADNDHVASRGHGHRLDPSHCIFQNFQSGEPAGHAHHAAARMGGRATHIEVLDRRAELRKTRSRTQEEKLLQRKLALKDVALAESEVALQIQRGQYLFVQDDVLDVGRILADGVNHIVAKGLALLVPVQSGPQLVRRILHKARENMLAGRRYRWIGQRRNHHVNVWTPGKVTVLRVVVGPLHVLNAGRDGYSAAQMRAWPRKTLEIRKRIERDVYLAGRASKLVTAN